MADKIVNGVEIKVGQVWRRDGFDHDYRITGINSYVADHIHRDTGKPFDNGPLSLGTSDGALRNWRLVADVLPPKPALTVESLARALFNTDERVRRDIGARAVEVGPVAVGMTETGRPYFQRAWDKNINGWRAEAEVRAAAMFEQLKAV